EGVLMSRGLLGWRRRGFTTKAQRTQRRSIISNLKFVINSSLCPLCLCGESLLNLLPEREVEPEPDRVGVVLDGQPAVAEVADEIDDEPDLGLGLLLVVALVEHVLHDEPGPVLLDQAGQLGAIGLGDEGSWLGRGG